MSTCEKCGTRCSGRLCQTHALDQLGARTDDADHDCPSCGGPTSGPDTVCYQCRGVE